jgi:hypothetical protein
MVPSAVSAVLTSADALVAELDAVDPPTVAVLVGELAAVLAAVAPAPAAVVVDPVLAEDPHPVRAASPVAPATSSNAMFLFMSAS